MLVLLLLVTASLVSHAQAQSRISCGQRISSSLLSFETPKQYDFTLVGSTASFVSFTTCFRRTDVDTVITLRDADTGLELAENDEADPSCSAYYFASRIDEFLSPGDFVIEVGKYELTSSGSFELCVDCGSGGCEELSVGETAGIAIGVIVAACIVCVVIASVVRSQQRKKRNLLPPAQRGVVNDRRMVYAPPQQQLYVTTTVPGAVSMQQAMPGQPMQQPHGQPMPGQPMQQTHGQPMPGQPMQQQPYGQPMGQPMPAQPVSGQAMPGQHMQQPYGQPMPGQHMPGQQMLQPTPGQHVDSPPPY